MKIYDKNEVLKGKLNVDITSEGDRIHFSIPLLSLKEEDFNIEVYDIVNVNGIKYVVTSWEVKMERYDYNIEGYRYVEPMVKVICETMESMIIKYKIQNFI